LVEGDGASVNYTAASWRRCILGAGLPDLLDYVFEGASLSDEDG